LTKLPDTAFFVASDVGGAEKFTFSNSLPCGALFVLYLFEFANPSAKS